MEVEDVIDITASINIPSRIKGQLLIDLLSFKKAHDKDKTHSSLSRKKLELLKSLYQLLDKDVLIENYYYHQHEWKVLPLKIDEAWDNIRKSKFKVDLSIFVDNNIYESVVDVDLFYDSVITHTEEIKKSLVDQLRNYTLLKAQLEANPDIRKALASDLKRKQELKEDADKLYQYYQLTLSRQKELSKFIDAFDKKYNVPIEEEMIIDDDKEVIPDKKDDSSMMIDPVTKKSTTRDVVTKIPESKPQKDGLSMIIEPFGMNDAQKRVFKSIEKRASAKVGAFKLFIDNAKKYMKESNLIMHIPLYSTVEKMVNTKDLYLKNLFETGTGRGSTSLVSRRKWEHNIFDSKEYDSFEPHEKVKYGTLNLSRHRIGCEKARQYGKSYLILQDHVKLRTTLTPGDSDSMGVENVGTFEFPENVIADYSPTQHKFLSDPLLWSSETTIFDDRRYTEAQIHGELLFSRDVAKIMIDKGIDHGNFRALMVKFFIIIGKQIEIEII